MATGKRTIALLVLLAGTLFSRAPVHAGEGDVSRDIATPTAAEAIRKDAEPAAPSGLLAEKMREIEAAADAAEVELERLPSLVLKERDRVIGELEKWANVDLRRILQDHYSEVERALASTTLPDDHSSVGIWWKQVKAGVLLNEDIEEVVGLFVKRAAPRLSEVQEALQREVLDSLEQRTQTLLRESMEEIRRPFIETIKGRLPLYNSLPLPRTGRTALVISLSGEQADRGRLSSGVGLVGGLVLTLLGRKLMQRMMNLAVMKIGGKVLSRVIPVIGVGMLLYEGIQMGQAKTAFEEELRKSFLAEYTADVTVDSVWNSSPDGAMPSMKQDMEMNVSSILVNWERICRYEAGSMIHCARILASSEYVRDYVDRELERGSDFQAVLQKVRSLWEAFGYSLALEPVEFFQSMLIDSPDRNDLAVLSRDGESRFIELYKAWGADFLRAVNRIGAENYVSTEWKSSDVNWSVLDRTLDFMPPLGGDRETVRGLLFLMQAGVPLDGISPDLMAKIAAKKEVFLRVWRSVAPDSRKLAALFTGDRPMDTLEPSVMAYPEASAIFLRDYGVEFWTSWSSEDIFDLLRISEFRGKSAGRTGAAAVRPDERVALLEVFRRTGERGIALWDVHATQSAGAAGQTLAERAIDCLAEGYPFDDLKDPELVRFAWTIKKYPGGRFIYDALKSVGSIVRYLLLALLLLAFAGVFFGVFKKIRDALRSPPSRYSEDEDAEIQSSPDVFAQPEEDKKTERGDDEER
ncbi:MAG: hypothetical protein BWY99_00499 [Synergistetes bacterium ADurb.BinA166]|nr:MAG: hypothetical protein BWY99_00499 [Synergistetes bacterium ADurb.BinA166]